MSSPKKAALRKNDVLLAEKKSKGRKTSWHQRAEVCEGKRISCKILNMMLLFEFMCIQWRITFKHKGLDVKMCYMLKGLNVPHSSQPTQVNTQTLELKWYG